MRNFEITQEQILELYGGNYHADKLLQQFFPEAFEKTLEVGKWYKEPSLNGAEFRLLCLQNIFGYGYGFDGLGAWEDELYYCNIKEWQEATPQEVKTALVAEAKKRGFKKGVSHKITNNNILIDTSNEIFGYDNYENKLLFNNWSIFHNGQWAETIETITKEEAEKLLNKKIV